MDAKTASSTFEIRAQWDAEAGAWVAESEDVPGLVAEADSPNLLVAKLKVLVPELLELNGVEKKGPSTFHIVYQHEDSCALTS